MNNRQNIAKAKAIERKNKERLLKVNPNLNNRSGIYFYTMTTPDGFKRAYIGQAVNLMQRCLSHMVGYAHIDLSLRKRGYYSADNPYGWKLGFMEFPKEKLDEKEKYYIKRYADAGYQLLNLTTGSQGEDKSALGEYKPKKGYQEGIRTGYKKASKEISHLFEKHLNYSTKSDKPNKNQQKALEKFKTFLGEWKGENNNGNDNNKDD